MSEVARPKVGRPSKAEAEAKRLEAAKRGDSTEEVLRRSERVRAKSSFQEAGKV